MDDLSRSAANKLRKNLPKLKKKHTSKHPGKRRSAANKLRKNFFARKKTKHTSEHPGKHHLSDDPTQFYKTLKVFFSSNGILSSEILEDQYLKVIVPHNRNNSNFLEKIFYESDSKNYLKQIIPFLEEVVSTIEINIKKYDTLFPHVFWFYDMCNRVLKKLNFWKDSVLKNKKRTLEIIEFSPDDVRPPLP